VFIPKSKTLTDPLNGAGDVRAVPRSLRAGADLSPTRRLHRNTYVPASTAVPRRPRGTHHGRAASSVPHRPRCTGGKPLEAHTPVHVIFGWERVDADTDTENDRHAYLPQERPRTQDPHRSQTNRASSTRLSAHQCGCHGQRTIVMQRWVGPCRRANAFAQPATAIIPG